LLGEGGEVLREGAKPPLYLITLPCGDWGWAVK
jgi:hypothetical protein